MKFGRQFTVYVETEAQRLLPEAPYVEFKRLKKLLKRCPHQTTSLPFVEQQPSVMITNCEDGDSEGAEENGGALPVANESTSSNSTCPVCDAEFFSGLDKAVSSVVVCFNARAKELLRVHMASGLRKYVLRLRSKISADRETMTRVGNMLVSYGCMNALAARKILKKYDKLLCKFASGEEFGIWNPSSRVYVATKRWKIHGSESGRAFKTRLQVRRVELLQSPLLIELGALAVNLIDSPVRRGPALPPAAQGQFSACDFDDDNQTITCSLPDGLRVDFDLKCSICLDVVFDPIALGCGHIFCNSCVCAAASVPVFHGANTAKRSAKCPLCRQVGVYRHAMCMEELYVLVRKRCTDYFQERLPEEREQRVREAKLYWDRETQKMWGM